MDPSTVLLYWTTRLPPCGGDPQSTAGGMHENVCAVASIEVDRLSFVLTQTQWGKMGPLSKCIARQQLVARYDVASLTGEPAHSLVGGARTVRRRCD